MAYYSSSDSDLKYPFPDELAHPRKKAGTKWGLQAAQAVYFNNDKNGPVMFYNNRDKYREWLDYALGQQDEGKYKPLLGINPRGANKSWVGAIRWNIKNYATKRINIAVEKMEKLSYDPKVDAIDPLANEHKEDYQARLANYMKNKEWVDKLETALKTTLTPGGISKDKIPESIDDLEIHMSQEFKPRVCMELEMGITAHMERNNFRILKGLVDFDLVCFGVGCYGVGMDENNMPTVNRENPARLVIPWSERPDFDNLKYAGVIEKWTLDQIVKRFSKDPNWNKQVYEEIKDRYLKNYNVDYYSLDTQEYNAGDTEKVGIMRFEFRTVNEMVHVDKKDKGGNSRFRSKDYDYYKTPKQQKKFKDKNKDSQLYRTPYTTVYEGYWVVGSDILLGWHEKHHIARRKGNMSEAPLGFKVFAPNLYDGKVVSTIERMIPILDDLQHYYVKVQELLSTPMPYGVGIDLDALREADLRIDGKNLSDQDKLELFFQRKVFVFSSKDKTTPGSNFKPFIEGQQGIKIAEYLSLIQSALFELDEVIGVNKITAASQTPPDQGAKVSQMLQQSTDNALGYLYRADHYLTQEVAKTLGLLHVQSVKYNPEAYKKGLGASSVEFLRNRVDLLKHDYLITVEPRPTQEEWDLLYKESTDAKNNGKITEEDIIALHQFQNLKQAREFLKYQIRKRERLAMQMQEKNVRMNGEEQRASADQKFQYDSELEKLKINGQIMVEREKRQTLKMETEMKGLNELREQLLENKGKLQQERQKSVREAENKVVDRILDVDEEKEKKNE